MAHGMERLTICRQSKIQTKQNLGSLRQDFLPDSLNHPDQLARSVDRCLALSANPVQKTSVLPNIKLITPDLATVDAKILPRKRIQRLNSPVSSMDRLHPDDVRIFPHLISEPRSCSRGTARTGNPPWSNKSQHIILPREVAKNSRGSVFTGVPPNLLQRPHASNGQINQPNLPPLRQTTPQVQESGILISGPILNIDHLCDEGQGFRDDTLELRRVLVDHETEINELIAANNGYKTEIAQLQKYQASHYVDISIRDAEINGLHSTNAALLADLQALRNLVAKQPEPDAQSMSSFSICKAQLATAISRSEWTTKQLDIVRKDADSLRVTNGYLRVENENLKRATKEMVNSNGKLTAENLGLKAVNSELDMTNKNLNIEVEHLRRRVEMVPTVHLHQVRALDISQGNLKMKEATLQVETQNLPAPPDPNDGARVISGFSHAGSQTCPAYAHPQSTELPVNSGIHELSASTSCELDLRQQDVGSGIHELTATMTRDIFLPNQIAAMDITHELKPTTSSEIIHLIQPVISAMKMSELSPYLPLPPRILEEESLSEPPENQVVSSTSDDFPVLVRLRTASTLKPAFPKTAQKFEPDGGLEKNDECVEDVDMETPTLSFCSTIRRIKAVPAVYRTRIKTDEEDNSGMDEEKIKEKERELGMGSWEWISVPELQLCDPRYC
jgi:regulator of replication initiation timing